MAKNTVTEIIKSIGKISNGGAIPQDGPGLYFYSHITTLGETLLLEGKGKYHFFYFDTDEIIQDMDSGATTWHVDAAPLRTSLSLVFINEGDHTSIVFTFSHDRKESADILKHLKKKKKIEITFLSMVFGELIKVKTETYRIPKETICEISLKD